MAINESDLTKGQLRKLNALRKSVGDSLGEATFEKWLKRQRSTNNNQRPGSDPVARMIADALTSIAKKKMNLGRHGYSVKRAKGKGATGLVVERIDRP